MSVNEDGTVRIYDREFFRNCDQDCRLVADHDLKKKEVRLYNPDDSEDRGVVMTESEWNGIIKFGRAAQGRL